MSITVSTFTIGPMGNNTYLLADSQQKIAAIVDPSFGIKEVLDHCEINQLKITDIFCTHAHFDHTAGINEITAKLDKDVRIWLHANDLPLWNMNGGADYFHFPFEIACQPTNFVAHLDKLTFGGEQIEVLLTPGHTPGHVIYYLESQHIVFCGDLVFRQSVGRTDLEGGNHLILLQSIDSQIKNLPDETRLLSGHGPETTVGFEKKHNPFF